MKIEGKNFKTESAFKNMMTVPDCFVANSNKLGGGHGEAKFYIASKDEMYDFYGGKGFVAKCFMLKRDLISYMKAIKNEYKNPSQNYKDKDKMPELWEDRMKAVNELEDIIYFDIHSQDNIGGVRGYVNSKDVGYLIIRQLALPLVSYVYSELLVYNDVKIYYWKLLVDFDAIWEKQNGPLVFNYGKGRTIAKHKEEKEAKITIEIKKARDGQGKYRELLLQQCHFCPITKVADERLLIASHIKPWAASDNKEKIDPFNGYILSPLYDKLFDRGFITFTEDRHMIISEAISPYTWKLLNIKNDIFIQELPMDDKRIEYLNFHHDNVFNGHFSN